MKSGSGSILVIEDDRELSAGLADAFELEGYQTTVLQDGPGGLKEALQGRHDLIILDVMLPGLSGFDLLRQLRSQGRTTPVLMLTAKGQEMDRVRGLKFGADDYVSKPFSIMELLARVEALLRRAGLQQSKHKRFEHGQIVVDFRARQAWKKRRPVLLTEREFQVFELLAWIPIEG